MQKADLAVVGGGPSGMAAALAAARAGGRGMSVAVLEKNDRVGKKLLLTGNGRCNLTNRSAGESSHYHGDAAAHRILKDFSPEQALLLFQKLGLLCRELDGGRIYPYSLQAASVLNVLRRNLDRCGVETVCGFDVKSVRKSDGGFLISSPEREFFARRLILAAGGSACPRSGSDGGGAVLAKTLGHTVGPLFPSLVQVKTDPARVRPLKGIRCPAAVSFRAEGEILRASAGEVQFTENALSGICIFELSRCVGEIRAPKNAEILLDLFPEYSPEKLKELLQTASVGAGDWTVSQLLEGFLPKALTIELSKYALGGASTPASRLSDETLDRLVSAAKGYAFPVRGTLSWDHAQVTAGGVPLLELTERLESKKCGGLYLCGELLDVDGDCGGYNLHWAWASGVTAGRAAAESLKGG
ncbi:NAD(P)/FAD-dependent oxidoreductase [Caproicibacter sp.]|uniref:NAD(P)/FAD-dependent oxidoreductase n=1 Tax=Caproicibacter sp. TaxID=2814884 RepID=UPI003988D019